MKRGFTLIELLAVIVILAIIALIAVPIVLNIIDDSKKESINRSIELYMNHVQKVIAKEQMKDPTFNPSECEIKPKGILECKNGTKTYSPIKIEMNGQMPESGKIKFSKGMVIEGKNIELDNLYYQVTADNISEGTKEQVISYSEYITKVSDADHDDKVSPGDEYTYKVNDTDTFTFYVLSVEGNKVNLIMDRNICGYPDSTNADNGKETAEGRTCLIAWYEPSDDNSNGPVTAMKELYNATKNWTNVPDMNLDYSDEGHIANSSKGYGKIETTATGIKITKKDGTTEVTRSGNLTPVIPYETNKPLKARLPKLEEVYNTDTNDTTHCHSNEGTCPAWLTNGLNQYSSYYPDNYHISGIYGYWTLSSYPGNSIYARFVSYYGNVFDFNTSYASGSGLRAVITVLKSDLA